MRSTSSSISAPDGAAVVALNVKLDLLAALALPTASGLPSSTNGKTVVEAPPPTTNGSTVVVPFPPPPAGIVAVEVPLVEL